MTDTKHTKKSLGVLCALRGGRRCFILGYRLTRATSLDLIFTVFGQVVLVIKNISIAGNTRHPKAMGKR
jgi:hypothetical protein